jgi:hypothetical protein
MKSSWHSLILSCHYSATASSDDSTHFHSSTPEPHMQAGWHPETRLSSTITLLYCPTLCTDPTENTTSIVKETCLLIPCVAMDLLLLRACAGICLPSRCLAIVLWVTIFSKSLKFYLNLSILRTTQCEDLHKFLFISLWKFMRETVVSKEF